MAIFKPPFGVRLKTGHPLAKGLVGCWVMNEGDGGIVNDLSGNGTIGTLVNAPTWSGGNLNFVQASEQYIDLGTDDIFKLQEHTILMSVNKITGYDFPLFTREYITSDGYEWHLGIDYANSGNISFAYYDTGIRGWYTVNTNLTVGVDYDLGLVWDKYNSKMKVYLDGVLFGENSTTNGEIKHAVRATKIAGRGYNTNTYGGAIGYTYVYNRVLTASEIASIRREPYSMFEIETPLWMLSQTGETPSGFNPSWARNSNQIIQAGL